jgi:hypothetical protein
MVIVSLLAVVRIKEQNEDAYFRFAGIIVNCGREDGY